jgi:DNA-binding response OmpR family regulator
MTRILLAEDESTLAEALADGLRREGYAVDVANDGVAALSRLAASDADLMILDRDLPRLSGDAVCRVLRGQGHPVRILMLTAAGSIDDRVAGLDIGADDYLAKPFAYVELLARLRALARRGETHVTTVLEVADVRLDTARRTAERAGHPLRLTPKEFGVFETLLAADGGWVSVDELFDEVWASHDQSVRSVVKAAVHTLRRKLGHPDPIESAPGHGYRIARRP